MNKYIDKRLYKLNEKYIYIHTYVRTHLYMYIYYEIHYINK